jgi:hypothetical protein
MYGTQQQEFSADIRGNLEPTSGQELLVICRPACFATSACRQPLHRDPSHMICRNYCSHSMMVFRYMSAVLSVPRAHCLASTLGRCECSEHPCVAAPVDSEQTLPHRTVDICQTVHNPPPPPHVSGRMRSSMMGRVEA